MRNEHTPAAASPREATAAARTHKGFRSLVALSLLAVMLTGHAARPTRHYTGTPTPHVEEMI